MLLTPAILAVPEQMQFFERLHTRYIVNAEREFGGPRTVELAENFLNLTNVHFGGLDVNSLRVGTIAWATVVDLDKVARYFNTDLLGQFFAKFLAVGLTGRLEQPVGKFRGMPLDWQHRKVFL
jgi:hypothetical protein